MLIYTSSQNITRNFFIKFSTTIVFHINEKNTLIFKIRNSKRSIRISLLISRIIFRDTVTI